MGLMGQAYGWISALAWKLCLGLNRGFRIVLEPLMRLNPVVALLAISLFTAVLMLLIFRAVSDQKAIRRTRDKIKAHLLEILLFNDNLKMVLRGQGCVVAYALKYLAHAVVPMLAILVPVALIVAQSNHFFESEPLRPQDAVTVRAKLARWDTTLAETVSISVAYGLSVETPALRIPERNEIVWRIRAHRYGDFNIVVNGRGETFSKRLVVADTPRCISRARVRPTLLGALLHSAERPLDKDSAVGSIEVSYPAARVRIGPARLHWLVPFFVFSMLAALLLKPFLKVEI